MYMLLVIVGGGVLLGGFLLLGRLLRGDIIGKAVDTKLLVPVWMAVAVVSMWGGVTRAGYMIGQALPMLLRVLAVPAAIARNNGIDARSGTTS